MLITFDGGRFVCSSHLSDSFIPWAAGFNWKGSAWETSDPQVAALLRVYCDLEAREYLDSLFLTHSPWTGPLPQPKGLKLEPIQERMARFILSGNRKYLAADPGVGKTPTAAVMLNALTPRTVYICPPFMTFNVERELKKWCTTWKPRILRYEPKRHSESMGKLPDIAIVSDKILDRDPVERLAKGMAALALSENRPSVLIGDEAHRFKTMGSVRTRAFLGDEMPGLKDYFSKVVLMSGTPMPNRPMELFPVLSKLAPQTIDFMDYDEYGHRFCGARYNGFGWEYKRASNLKELKLRTQVWNKFMLRVRKSDAGLKLPPKTEEVVIIGERPAKAIKLEATLLKRYSPQDLMANRVSSDHVSTYRRELGAFKVKPAIEFVREILQDTDESVLLFAYHREVIEKLSEGLKRFKPVVIYGGVSNATRDAMVREFQKPSGPRLFIANYIAGGIGLTLTKASRVVFVEFSWVPEAENDQASDRAHRYGQERPVHVQYVVYENSIDRTVIEVCLRKRRITQSL